LPIVRQSMKQWKLFVPLFKVFHFLLQVQWEIRPFTHLKMKTLWNFPNFLRKKEKSKKWASELFLTGRWMEKLNFMIIFRKRRLLGSLFCLLPHPVLSLFELKDSRRIILIKNLLNSSFSINIDVCVTWSCLFISSFVLLYETLPLSCTIFIFHSISLFCCHVFPLYRWSILTNIYSAIFLQINK
jgi:hypothetical protein